ncbi:unnamed protein product [Ophioblennius macclurei]
MRQARSGASGETLYPEQRGEKSKQAAPFPVMASKDAQQDLEYQFNDVVSRLQSKQFFQSTWDIVSSAVFFAFVGMVLMLLILVLIRCFCCCDSNKPRKRKVGIDNFALEP